MGVAHIESSVEFCVVSLFYTKGSLWAIYLPFLSVALHFTIYHTKEKFDHQINILLKAIQKLEKEHKAEDDIRNNKLGWLNDIVKHGYITELNREILVNMVEMIFITGGNQISITFKYADEYKRLENYIKKVQQKKQGAIHAI